MSKTKASDIEWGGTLPPDLARLIEQYFVSAFPKKPVRLPRFASASLPAAADWLGAEVYATDKGCAAISNGAAWVRPDGTAL